MKECYKENEHRRIRRTVNFFTSIIFILDCHCTLYNLITKPYQQLCLNRVLKIDNVLPYFYCVFVQVNHDMPRESCVVYVDFFLVLKHLNICIRVAGRVCQTLLITRCKHIWQYCNLHFAILNTINTMQCWYYKLIIKFNVINPKYPRSPTQRQCFTL